MHKLASMDAALGVNHLEISIGPARHGPPGCRRSRLGTPLTDVNFGVRHALFRDGIKAETNGHHRHYHSHP